MKIKKGNTVKIIAGKDKGKTGVVLAAMPLLDKVIVEGINIVVRHKKGQGKDKPAGRIKVPAPIHVSNVMLDKAPKAKTVKADTKSKTSKPAAKKAVSKSKKK